MRWRFAALLFLYYATQGALVPLFSLRLQELGFTPLQIGWTCATQALAGLLAPFVAGQLADRWFPAERCLALFACLAGALLWLLAGLTRPLPVFATSLAVWLVLSPASTLSTALSFVHLPAPSRDFGPVRLWGTVGWIGSGWLIGYGLRNPSWLGPCAAWLHGGISSIELADAFRFAGLLAFGLGAYALSLPATPPARCAQNRLAPGVALRLLRDRSFAVYWGCAFGVCVTISFTTQVNPLLLEHLGVSRAWLSPTLTLNQSMEMAALAILPVLLGRLGLRRTMLLGLGSWLCLLGVLTAGAPLALLVAALSLNGLCTCCFLVSGQIFVNSRAADDIRASAQALVTFIYGLGMLVGHVFTGWVRDLANGEFHITFGVSAGLAALLLAAFLVGFRVGGTLLPFPGGSGTSLPDREQVAVAAAVPSPAPAGPG